LQQFCSIVLAEPRGGRSKGEGRMIYLGRAIGNSVKVFQDKVLAIICPLAGKTPLNKR
jgi:hypothetical protein